MHACRTVLQVLGAPLLTRTSAGQGRQHAPARRSARRGLARPRGQWQLCSGAAHARPRLGCADPGEGGCLYACTRTCTNVCCSCPTAAGICHAWRRWGCV